MSAPVDQKVYVKIIYYLLSLVFLSNMGAFILRRKV